MENNINERIHTEIMGVTCAHSEIVGDEGIWSCKQCGLTDDNLDSDSLDLFSIPDYTTDLNAVREVEIKIIQTLGTLRYDDALLKIVGEDVINMGISEWVLLTAETRARACLAAIEKVQGEK